MFAYEKPTVIRWVKEWDSLQPVGITVMPSEAADGVRALRSRSYDSPAGYGAQTVRRVLIEHCGWIWEGRQITKLAMPELVI